MSLLIYCKNPNGTTYVYENVSYWDKKTKTTKHRRKSIGHIDPTSGKIVPNRKKGDAAKKRATLQPATETKHCTVHTSGVTRLLNKAVSDINLQKALA